MKKILIFSLAYYPRHVSGAEAAIKEITDRIDSIDIEFHMVTLRFDSTDAQEEKLGNVMVHRIGGGSYVSKIFFPFSAAFKTRTLHRIQKFDALWAMMTYMLLPTVLAQFLGVRIPYILTLQDGDPYERVFGRTRILPFLPLIDYGFRHASLVQVISSYLATWPPRRGFRGETVLIHNGANPRDLKESVTVKEVAALKRKLNKKDDEIWLVNTARLEYQKAQDVVIRALPLLPTNIKFLIVGGGSDETMLKKLTEDLGIETRVVFTGYIDRSEVTTYRKVADIFVAPSRSEGLGNAFLSAMASKLPVIATQEGGLTEFVFDAKRNPGKTTTAWVVDKDSPQQIAEAVKDILEHPKRVEEVTRQARDMVLEKFNWDTIAQDMRDKVFKKIV